MGPCVQQLKDKLDAKTLVRCGLENNMRKAL